MRYKLMSSTNDLFCSYRRVVPITLFSSRVTLTTSPTPSMAKRPTSSKDAPPRQRKRWRNGVSSTTQVLDFSPPIPPAVDVMRVWHRNDENSDAAQESNTPIPKPCDPPPLKRTVQFEALDVTDVSYGVNPRPKRKNRNDSVSLFFNPTNHTFSERRFSFKTRMEAWITLRTTILDEIIRHDGLQDHDSLPTCAHCYEETGAFRCRDCTQVTLYCSPCIVQRHEHLPLHCIEVFL